MNFHYTATLHRARLSGCRRRARPLTETDTQTRTSTFWYAENPRHAGRCCIYADNQLTAHVLRVLILFLLRVYEHGTVHIRFKEELIRPSVCLSLWDAIFSPFCFQTDLFKAVLFFFVVAKMTLKTDR